MEDLKFTQILLDDAGLWIDGFEACKSGEDPPSITDFSPYAIGYRSALLEPHHT